VLQAKVALVLSTLVPFKGVNSHLHMAHTPALQEAVEACLAQVAAGEAPRLLRLAWEQHQGTLCRGVSWDRHTLQELQLVAECIGGRPLAGVCRLLAQDHAGWSGGCLQQ